MRSLDDVKVWLTQPCTGTAETGAAPWWRLALKYRPDVRIVVVRRPVAEVVESLLAVSPYKFDRVVLTKMIGRLDAKLDQIERRMPDVISVRFDDLKLEEVCKRLFEHCLPYPHSHEWWSSMDRVNVQCSMPGMFRYAEAYRAQMAKMIAMARQAILADMAGKPVHGPDGLTFKQESLDDLLRDGVELFPDHSVEVEESPHSYLTKNIPLMRTLDQLGNMQIVTARCNGRMFGYLMTILSPSLESLDKQAAINTLFYASKEFPGLGMKLQRAALELLRAKGFVGKVSFRAGPRGSGPRMGVLYRRLGAEADGEMYSLVMEGTA